MDGFRRQVAPRFLLVSSTCLVSPLSAASEAAMTDTEGAADPALVTEILHSPFPLKCSQNSVDEMLKQLETELWSDFENESASIRHQTNARYSKYEAHIQDLTSQLKEANDTVTILREKLFRGLDIDAIVTWNSRLTPGENTKLQPLFNILLEH